MRFELLSDRHDRSRFTCGSPALDDWFHRRARQDQRRRVAQVFVATEGAEILGFYGLGMFTLGLDILPPALAKKLPRYEAIPAALIGRLARASGARGKGMGDLLLADAILRVLGASESVAAYATVVDAQDAHAQRFYESHGFIPLASNPLRLFLLTQTAAGALPR